MYPKLRLYVKECNQGARDRFGNEVNSYGEPVVCEKCLFAPGAPSDIGDDRPEGVRIAATAYFPRGWAHRLKRALISYDGVLWLRVIGEPIDMPSEVTPLNFPWSVQVLLEVADG